MKRGAIRTAVEVVLSMFGGIAIVFAVAAFGVLAFIGMYFLVLIAGLIGR